MTFLAYYYINNDMAKFLTGGRQTTINSTITELFPALAFNNKKQISSADNMSDYVVSLAEKKSLVSSPSRKSFVDNGDVKSAYNFIDDIFMIRPDMRKEKLNNAVGILKYLYDVNRARPIEKVIWGYRAKPQGVPGNHAGDIFIVFKSGSPKISGISLKAGTTKSAEPKMNSYVRTTIKKDMWVKSDSQSEKKLKVKLWKQCYSKLPGIPKSVNENNWIDITGKAQKPHPEVVKAVLKQFKRNEKKFDELYQIQNKVCRQHMCDLINKDLNATKDWISQEFRLQTPGSSDEVPLTLVKAIGMTADEQGDKLAKIFPKINKVRAYLNNASVQEWFLDVFAGSKRLTLMMTIRSDSEYREAKQKGKLGAYMGLKLLYRGYK